MSDRTLIFVSRWTQFRFKMNKIERDRAMTEERLIKAVGDLIVEEGFESLGVRKVADQAKVNKTLIYRYFDSLDGLIYAYMKRHDFWINYNEKPDITNIKVYLKALYRRQITEYRNNISIKRLRRWELSTDKDFIVELRTQREENGMQYVNIISQFAQVDKEQMQAIFALIDAGITYLAMFEDNCQKYSGVDIQSDGGWQQITKAIDMLIDVIIK